jgi:hypothetical protein
MKKRARHAPQVPAVGAPPATVAFPAHALPLPPPAPTLTPPGLVAPAQPLVQAATFPSAQPWGKGGFTAPAPIWSSSSGGLAAPLSGNYHQRFRRGGSVGRLRWRGTIPRRRRLRISAR